MSRLVAGATTFSDHRTPPFTAESYKKSKKHSYRWSKLVFEMKVGQNLEWRLFDVSGNVIGYARVSTRGQSLDSQVDALVAAGAVRVFQEYASGATQARTRWKECLEYLQPGNVLTVADLTRLGRSTAERMWVTVTHRSGDRLVGTLDNYAIFAFLKPDEEVKFHIDDIIDCAFDEPNIAGDLAA